VGLPAEFSADPAAVRAIGVLRLVRRVSGRHRRSDAASAAIKCGSRRAIERLLVAALACPASAINAIDGQAVFLVAALFVGGFAAPPQLDLLVNSGYYKDGRFKRPPFVRLALD